MKKEIIIALISGGIGASIIGFVLPKLFPENNPPKAIIKSFETTGEAPIQLLFDAAESYDPESQKMIYKWYVNDTIVDSTDFLKYKFTVPGTYRIKLKVIDSKKMESTDSELIKIYPTKKTEIKKTIKYQTVWIRQDDEGNLISQKFEHMSENRHNAGGKQASGIYTIDNKEGRIYKITFRHEGEYCGWNYNPNGGYSGNTEILNNTTFKWNRLWDGWPCKEIYEAFYEIPKQVPYYE